MLKKPYLIAEIGINHNGSLEITKKLIKNAKEAKFDAVKFQKRDLNLVYSQELLESHRESPWGTTQREQKEGLEFGKEQYDEINNFCKDIKIEWFASAWDINSLKFLDQYNLNYNKIASAMIVDKGFLKEVAKRKKHTFISTGMSTLKDIEDAVGIFQDIECSFELMHCVSTYPMKVEDANLLTINSLKNKFKCDVGYSGHKNGVAVSLAAFSLNISSLERHITLDRTMYGSDQAASIEARNLKNLGEMLRNVPLIKGDGKKIITSQESVIRKKLRIEKD